MFAFSVNQFFQAYHVKEMANFSKDSVSTAAKILDPNSRLAESPNSRPMPESMPSRKRATVVDGVPRSSHRPTVSYPMKTTNHGQLQPELHDNSKFDHILSWNTLPAAPRMLLHQKNYNSQKAADLFRAIDTDNNSKLSSVEFFEGMTTKFSLSRDQVLHLMNIHKPKQQGFYSLQEFEEIYLALQPPEEVASQQLTGLEPIDGDDDVCVIFDSPMLDQNRPNLVPLTRKNAGALIF
jgi:hypothetical protein